LGGDENASGAKAGGGFEAVGKARGEIVLEHQSIDDDFDGAMTGDAICRDFLEGDDFAIDPESKESFAADAVQEVGRTGIVGRASQRGENHDS
jgi:hypothetical protein